jgi:hypothetical protein
LVKNNHKTMVNQQQMMVTADLTARNRAAARDYMDKAAKEVASMSEIDTQGKYMREKDARAERSQQIAMLMVNSRDYEVNPALQRNMAAYVDGKMTFEQLQAAMDEFYGGASVGFTRDRANTTTK